MQPFLPFALIGLMSAPPPPALHPEVDPSERARSFGYTASLHKAPDGTWQVAVWVPKDVNLTPKGARISATLLSEKAGAGLLQEPGGGALVPYAGRLEQQSFGIVWSFGSDRWEAGRPFVLELRMGQERHILELRLGPDIGSPEGMSLMLQPNGA